MSTESEWGDTTTDHDQSGPDTEDEYVLDPAPNPWRRDPAMKHYRNASREEWGDYYNVHAQFLPWAHSKLNGFEALQQLTPFFESRPDTSKQVSTSRITSHLGIDHHTADAFCLEDIALLSGWWRGGSNPASGSYFCNPEYPHGHDDSEYALANNSSHDQWGDYRQFNRRLGLLDRAASLALSCADLQHPFGAESRKVPRKWAEDNYYPWGERRMAGMVRMARTWRTIHKWGDGDYSYRDIAEAFGLPKSTLMSRLNRFAPDFEPPRDPNYRKVEVSR